MDEQADLVTVFRSADPSSQEEAEEVREALADAGFSPVLLGDDAPGVPSGACEVRVASAEAARAEELIARMADALPERGDASHDLDLESVFDALGTTAELESLGVRAVLDSNGIPSVLVGAQVYPNLRFLVKVPRRHAGRARQALAEARAAGPAAAEEAESVGETPAE